MNERPLSGRTHPESRLSPPSGVTDPLPWKSVPAPGAVPPPQVSGLLLLDKPTGVSSFEALKPIKRIFRGNKIGHAGTLDPAASGLLLIGIGSATRLLEYLEGLPKTYAFLSRFGIVSDTYDMEGNVSVTGSAARKTADIGVAGAATDMSSSPARFGAPVRAELEKALKAFRGPIRQMPPVYSAIKIAGKRACDRVRAGESITLEARDVVIHSLELKSYAAEVGTAAVFAADSDSEQRSARVTYAGVAALEMTCSKGTYVRSLVHDLGQALGCGAVADGIRRTAIGPFRVEAAQLAPPPSVYAPGNRLEVAEPIKLLPMETAVAHLPGAVVEADHLSRFLMGQALNKKEFALRGENAGGLDVRALDVTGRLLGIATIDSDGRLFPKKILVKN